MRLGIGVSEDLPVAVQQRIATHVEAAGFSSLWTNESSGRDALLLCQAWGAVTTDLQVGVGVLPLWTRSSAQLAMASATLQEATGGRFLLGLGVSHAATMGPRHGLEVVRPLTATRETLAILRQLEAGETSSVAGVVRSSEGFRLAITPRPPATRCYLAAMGPRMLALAGTSGDGVLLNWAGPASVAASAAVVRDAAAGAGRDPAEVDVTTYVRVAMGRDRDRARAALGTQLARYAMLPSYAAHFARQGLASGVEAVQAAVRAGGDGADVARAAGDEMLATIGWVGTPDDDVTGLVESFRAAGLDHLVVRVVAVDDPVDSVRDVVRAFDAWTG